MQQGIFRLEAGKPLSMSKERAEADEARIRGGLGGNAHMIGTVYQASKAWTGPADQEA
jgi:hypothetical protein